MKLFKKKKKEEPSIIITDDTNIEDVIKALAELEPKKVDRVVALAKALREYNQKLKALKKGVEDTPDEEPESTGPEFLETEF